ncbi:MAG: hypothetical protein ACT6FE_00955 [Methanosarcinaceae archaeon]
MERYKQVVDNFSKLVFIQDEDDFQVLNKNTKVSLAWLKEYSKQEFHKNKKKLVKRNKHGNKTNTYVLLQNTEFLLEKFQLWVNKNWQEKNQEDQKLGILNNLKVLEKQPLESQKRNADFAYYIHQIHRRTNFKFIYEFFKNTQGVADDVLISETTPILNDCKDLLKNIENYLRPKQSFGHVIERASLNYYTVNKKPKNYPDEIKNIENKKGKKILEIQTKNRKIVFSQSLCFLKDEIKRLDDKYFVVENFNETGKFIKEWNHLKLQYAYKFLKEYKAEQKSKFYELTLQEKMQATIKHEVPLFDFVDIKIKKTKEKQFQDFYDDCIVIQDKSTKYEQSKDKKLKTEITNLKIARGKKYFDIQNKNNPFPKYKTLCELFKEVAMEYGKIKAEVKSLEKEQVEAERLQSWAMLLEKENQHYVMTIPRDRKVQVGNKEEYQLPHAYKKIKQLKDTEAPDYWKLYLFESLTLRALEKLCFGTDKNTFITDSDLLEELKKISGFFEKGKLKRKDEMIKENSDKTWNESELIKFYQAILSIEATKKMILVEEYLPDEITKKSICEKQFENLRDFQVALEKACYIRKEIRISNQKKEKLEKKYGANIYQITSYNLFEQRKNKKEHTKIWKRFWNQDKDSGYMTRLNPQFSISYVEKRVGSIKDKSGNEVKRNRRKQAEYILSTTISENNDKPKFDMAFANKEKVIKNINIFNEVINKKIKADPYNVYYYGIDRGNEELLTLGIFKFEDKDVDFIDPTINKSGTYKKPVPVDLEIWELPEDKLLKKVPYETKNGTKYTEAYKNISYAEDLLKKGTIQSCLDLTSAKLIDEKIVRNGDIATFMNLKLENAKRKMIEQVGTLIQTKTNKKGIEMAKIKYRKKSKKKAEHFELNITTEDGNTKSSIIYFISSEFEKTKIKPDLEKYLQEILKEIKTQGCISVNVPITKINNLRDAICANAVGILNFLQKKHFGIISFEDLDIETKNEHFSQQNINLGSRIEFMLLNKFKTLGLVPPNYKMVMSMQSKKEIDQLGIFTYIKTRGTSSDCPHCGQGIDDNMKNEHKWKHHKFRCCNNEKSCGFSTYSQKEIDENKYEFVVDKKGLNFLNTSDDVASYNIAKQGLELIINKTQFQHSMTPHLIKSPFLKKNPKN